MADTERFQIRFTPEVKEAVAAHAEAAGVSMNDVINAALERFLAAGTREAAPLAADALAGLGEQLLSVEINLKPLSRCSSGCCLLSLRTTSRRIMPKAPSAISVSRHCITMRLSASTKQEKRRCHA